MSESTQRFSNRVADYVRYRPNYPNGILKALEASCGLNSSSVVADVGSGTGISTELFLRNGHTVFAVEPNDEMRAAAEKWLVGDPHFHSVKGTAEATSLGNHGVDFVVAGQAFHWFDQLKSRAEFNRILKPSGWVILIWNERLVDATPFLQAYEHLLEQFATDYKQVDHRQIDERVLAAFFSPQKFEFRTFPNHQDFDYDGLQGRLLSSSYAPDATHPNHAPMLAQLKRIFDTNQESGRIKFLYSTKVYFGRLE